MKQLSYATEKQKPEGLERVEPPIPPTHTLKPREAEQILHLKRLLVTLKQQYEKNLLGLQEKLDLQHIKQQNLEETLKETSLQYSEETESLQQQLVTMHEMLKKTQEELKVTQERTTFEGEWTTGRQRINQLEQLNAYIQEQSALEISQVKQEVERAERQLAEQKSVRLELPSILESSHFEEKFIALLAEKIALEHSLKQTQGEINLHQTHIEAFKEQVKEAELAKHQSDAALQETERELFHLRLRLIPLEKAAGDAEQLHEKYDQLKEEFALLSDRYEEAIELRLCAEKESARMQALVEEQQHILELRESTHRQLEEEKEQIIHSVRHLERTVEDSEGRFKIAQQHLAKKVKESALLTQQIEEKEHHLNQLLEKLDASKEQIRRFEMNLEHYQQQEKRLQDQLQEALKGNESQTAKWEEKYFQIYDKLHEKEARLRSLEKFEEKYLQMQNLIVNLGTFMGGQNHPTPSLAANTELAKLTEESHPSSSPLERETGYDLFGNHPLPNQPLPSFLP